MACDGYIAFKVFELVASVLCMIFKRVTDEEANRLFYFLQRASKEWPLLNNIFWGENGAIFADITYGGYAVISMGLLIGQAAGELRNVKHTENFLLTMGGLMYFGTAGLELAALDSVQPNLVDNAAILGVVSLVTGLVFIVDLLLGSKRRRKPIINHIQALGYDKNTQTEDAKRIEVVSNGNVSGEPVFKKVPLNGVKILPTSPPMEDTHPNYHIPITNSHNEYIGTISAPPIYSPQELHSPKVKIRSTESFLRAEKGQMPVVRRPASPDEFYIPPGYMLVPAKSMDNDAPTPPGYASVEPKSASVTPRKLQSPTVTTTIKTPQGYYFSTDSREPSPTEDAPIQRSALPKERPWPLAPKPKTYIRDIDENDSPFRRSSPFRTSNKNLDSYGRFERSNLTFPVEIDDASLDGHRIEEEMKRIRNITKSDVDISAEMAKENQVLKEILRKEKEEKAKLKGELKKSELEERKRLEERVYELEEYQAKLEKELKEEERKKLEQKIKELEEEKDRRMSEKEIQYFGVNDLRFSKKESSPITEPSEAQVEEYFRTETEKKGAKDVNSKLKEKNVRRQKDEDELRQVIEEGFNFLDEEERKKRSGKLLKDVEEHRAMYNQRREAERITTKREIEEMPSRGETPGAGSYKSEKQMWIPGSPEPLSPKDPGYVLHTVQNWPESTSTSPTDRFRFTAQKAHQTFKIANSISPSPDFAERGSSGDGEDYEERPIGRRKGLLLRKVDFPDDPVTGEIERPATVTGSTSTWKKWLHTSGKPKVQVSRSVPIN